MSDAIVDDKRSVKYNEDLRAERKRLLVTHWWLTNFTDDVYRWLLWRTVKRFIDIIERKRNLVATNNLMIPMGREFDYGNALPWFLNIDKLKNNLNSNFGVNVVYSSPSCYAKSVFHIAYHKNYDWIYVVDRFLWPSMLLTYSRYWWLLKNFIKGNSRWKDWSSMANKRRWFLADCTGSWSIWYRPLFFSACTEGLYLGLLNILIPQERLQSFLNYFKIR